MPEPIPSLIGSADQIHGASSTDQASNTYLDNFSELDGSVPNLAATLTTQAEADAEEANISFLRGQMIEGSFAGNYGPAPENHEASRRRRRRTVDTMLGGRQYTASEMREIEMGQDRLLGEGPDAQDYRGWAPGISDGEDDEDEPSLDTPGIPRAADEEAPGRLSHDLRERMRNRLRRDYLEAHLADRAERRLESQHRDDTNGNEPVQGGTEIPPIATESSLRTTALLQAVRRNSQFSQYSRNQLQRYILDRERVGLENEEGREATGSARASGTDLLSPSQRRQINREASTGDFSYFSRQLDALHHEYEQNRNARLDEQSSLERRRQHPQAPSPCPARDRRSIGNTIRYLERLRFCESRIECIETATENGFEQKEQEQANFVLDTTKIFAPPKSSWLHVGAVFSGTQTAVTPSPCSSSSALRSYIPLMPPSQYRSRTMRHPTFGPTIERTTSPVQMAVPTTYTPSGTGPTSQRPAHLPSENRSERWPVKVSIHGIDYDDMTLSGTMEAFNVPDKSSPTRRSSITTFLEGEIIDFDKHTLETKTFKADSRADAGYWRKLPPFRDLKDDEAMIQSLVSQEWLRNELMEKWILMRWKEKCFVTPSDAQSSLTISGFYYLSLRRADGQVEGLYYDPHLTPYQHLILQPETRTFPSYTFQ